MGRLLTGCDAANTSKPPEVNALSAPGVGNAIVFQTKEIDVDVTSGTGPDLLTLPQAVRQALSADAAIQGALAKVRAARSDADQARLLPNPIFSILFRFPGHPAKPIIETELGFELMSLLQRSGRMSAADSRLRAAAAEAMSAVLDAILDTQSHYAAAQALDAEMPVLEERRKLTARLLKLARDRLASGEAIRLDVSTLETQRLELEVEIRQRRLERREERLTLARLIGRPSIEPGWKLDPWEAPNGFSPDESAWVAAAMEHRPEVQSRRWELAALGVETRLARFSPFDAVEIGGKGERDQAPDDKWTVGPAVSFPLPLFDWGQSKRDKARALEIEARHGFTQVRRQVIEEVRRSFVSFVESIGTANLAANELVPAQERRRQETESAYRAGQADVTTLIVAEQELQTSREKLIELQLKASTSLFKLERAVGGSCVVCTLKGLPGPAPSNASVSPVGIAKGKAHD